MQRTQGQHGPEPGRLFTATKFFQVNVGGAQPWEVGYGRTALTPSHRPNLLHRLNCALHLNSYVESPNPQDPRMGPIGSLKRDVRLNEVIRVGLIQ